VLKARPYQWVCKSGAQSVDKQNGAVVTCHRRNGYRFSVITRTIFENTKIPLNLWFKIGYLMLTAKKGISALQIHRVMFGENSTHDYHTSWYICMRWRAAMAGDMYEPLSGIVEVDETYVGGKDRNRHWGKKSAQQRKAAGELFEDKIGFGKVGVIGSIQRKGNVVARVIGSKDPPILAGICAPSHRQTGTVGRDRREYVLQAHGRSTSGCPSFGERMGARKFIPIQLNRFGRC
jgi:hypothetical protein